jgi:peptidoglycan LD-endopeptidase CwlK
MRAPPPEIPVDRSLDSLAPQFRAAVEAVLAELGDAKVSEGMRTFERQSFLYGFGREYDDGRGIVTNAATNLLSWHGYGLAVDVVHQTKEWDAGDAWFRLLGDVAKAHGCHWGGDWHHPDKPHIQWGKCKDSPSDEARSLYEGAGVEAVWDAVGAS